MVGDNVDNNIVAVSWTEETTVYSNLLLHVSIEWGML